MRSFWKCPRLISWVTDSFIFTRSLCSALLCPRNCVTQRQKYLAKSLQRANGFSRWRVVSFLNSALKPLMPETRLSPDMYFRRSWSPWLGYCTLPEEIRWNRRWALHLSSRRALSETVMCLSGWSLTGFRLLLKHQYSDSESRTDLPKRRCLYSESNCDTTLRTGRLNRILLTQGQQCHKHC